MLSPVQADIRVEDALGRQLVLKNPAVRIVSLAPHITEVVFAAGAGEQLVGAVSYSDYPEAAKDIPRVGSYDSVSLETLVALGPDLILAWRSGNGDEVVKRLGSLGLTVYVDEPKTLEDVAQSLRVVGQLTGNDDTANAAAQDFMDALLRLRETYSERETIGVYYQIWDEPLLTLNGDHLISDVVRLCGGSNVFADAITLVSRISVESVIRADPQVIIASGMDQARPQWLDAWRQWDSMQAVQNKQLYFVPPDLLQRHTPRIIQGAEILCRQLQQAREYYGERKN
ncbi:MAG: cobalamin-binding protein [Gammaproteobacteria bacterium]|nr:MAG: cobalamin-binding protein [Gammaproteobacteria bacterium]